MKALHKTTLLALLAAGALSAACAHAADAVQRGGTLVYGRYADSIFLEPVLNDSNNDIWILSNLYDTLLLPTRNGKGIEAGLATAWKVADDGKSVTLTTANLPFGVSETSLTFGPQTGLVSANTDYLSAVYSTFTDFGGTTDVAYAVAVSTVDGTIVAVGASNKNFAFVRYDANGHLNNNFGAGGRQGALRVSNAGFAEMEDRGRQHRAGMALHHTLHKIIQ